MPCLWGSTKVWGIQGTVRRPEEALLGGWVRQVESQMSSKEDRVSERRECYRKGQEQNVFTAFGKNTVICD